MSFCCRCACQCHSLVHWFITWSVHTLAIHRDCQRQHQNLKDKATWPRPFKHTGCRAEIRRRVELSCVAIDTLTDATQLSPTIGNATDPIAVYSQSARSRSVELRRYRHFADATQLNSTSSWVELCRYKRALTALQDRYNELNFICLDIPLLLIKYKLLLIYYYNYY